MLFLSHGQPGTGFLDSSFPRSGRCFILHLLSVVGQERGLIGYDGLSDAGSSPAVPIGGAGTGYSHTGCTP